MGSPGKSEEERKHPDESDNKPDTMVAHGEEKNNKTET